MTGAKLLLLNLKMQILTSVKQKVQYNIKIWKIQICFNVFF